MPLSGVRYRRKGKMRLAFRGDQVVEAKNMDSGATHTPQEFARDRSQRRRRHPSMDALARRR
jgi:hypothetical protein